MIEIRQLQEVTPQALQEILTLARVLHEDDRDMTAQEMETMLADTSVIVMTVQDDGRIIGMATLYVIPKFGKKNSLLEDVIVDSDYRGQGLGEKLMRAVIDKAREEGVGSITLTSRQERVAAHRLYEKLGFEKKEADVLKLAL